MSVADPADRAIVLKYAALERRWHDLAAGLYADATPTEAGAPGQPVVGVAPVLDRRAARAHRGRRSRGRSPPTSTR
jgi:hypothetical protein